MGDDPDGNTNISDTLKAKTEAMNNVLGVLHKRDINTWTAIANAIAKAFPNPNGTTPPNGQRLFSR